MSIASEIARINTNIAAAYTACSDKNAAMPHTQDSANLADTIQSIPQGSDISNIVSAIQTKTGISGDLSAEQAVLDILTSSSRPVTDIPSYIRTEAKRLASVVKSHQTANSVSFICCSDSHESGSDTSKTVSEHAAMAAYLVRQYAPIDFGVFLGDYVRGSSSDTEESTLAQYKTMLPLLSWWADAMTQGNHDNGMAWWDGFLSSDTMYSLIGRHALHAVRPSAEADRGYYYFDVPDKNFRVIVLNTNDHKGIAFLDHSVSGGYNDGHRVSVPQLNWFAQTLAAIPSGYKFIVCSHEPIHWGSASSIPTYTDKNNVTWDMTTVHWGEILDAYIGGTSYSITQDGQTISGSFENSHNGVCCGTFHGHTHNFIDGKYGDNEIMRISTPNACSSRTNEYGSTSYGQAVREKYGELDGNGNQVTAYFKTNAGTTNETAFVVNTVDFDNMVVYSDYYGAGRDRVISLGSTVLYSVTNNISSHCATSNNSTIAESGSSYTATITADTNYTASVTVLMGGNDITSTAYSNGVISIADVTGDIVITARAIFSGNYVSVVGYTDGKRWSTSTGNQSSAADHTAVNEITFDRSEMPVSFLLSGINWSADSNCTLVAAADGTFKYGAYLNAESDSASAGVKKELLANGEVKLTLYQGTDPSYSGINGFKVSGYGSGANAVITRVSAE